jgi:predicted regulator of Ras-like GTPase activity (Roadblock/LC7/MglB family)
MLSLEETLQSLRDVDGVQGSFVIAPSGALVAKDLPAIFDGELFSEVGPRIARLYETFLSGGEEMDACVLRYAEHKLYVRKLKAGMVGTISASKVNMAALRMVVNLVIRRLDPEMGRISVATPPALPRTPPPPPTSIPAPFPLGRPPSTRASAPPSARTHDGAGPISSPARSVTLPSVAVPSTNLSDDDRDPTMPMGDRHVRMYRGRPVGDE